MTSHVLTTQLQILIMTLKVQYNLAPWVFYSFSQASSPTYFLSFRYIG